MKWWYFEDDNAEYLYWSEGVGYDVKYGISRGEWRNFESNTYWILLTNGYKPATNEQITRMLGEIADKKGLVAGAKVYRKWIGDSVLIDENYNDKCWNPGKVFERCNLIIFKDGKWAEVVKPTKFKAPLHNQIIEIGGHKYKLKTVRK